MVLDRRDGDRPALLLLVCCAALLIAPAAAWIRSLLISWQPEGDDATIVLRARELFRGEVPLQGMRSTAGGTDPALANHHLGPLEMHLLGPASGLEASWPVALTCVGLVALCSVSAAAWARRTGGDPALLVVTVGALMLQWAIGPDAMFRPFNPFFGLVPAFLSLVLLTAHLHGVRGLGWPIVASTGIVAQANLALAPLGLGLLGAAAVVAAWRGGALRHRRTTEEWLLSARRPAKNVRLGVVAALLVWGPVLIEPLRHDPGNLRQLVRAAGAGGPSQGAGWALERVGLLAPVPGGFRGLGTDLVYTPSLAAQVVGWGMVLTLVAAAAPLGHPGRRSVATAPARAALVGLGLMLVTFAVLPAEGLAAHYLAGAVPVTVFAWTALLWRGLMLLPTVRRRLPHRHLITAAAAVTLLAASLMLVARPVSTGASDAGREVSELVLASPQLAPGSDVLIHGSGFVTSLSTTPALALALDRQGFEVHYLPPWPLPEDAERLAVDAAPAGSASIFLFGGSAPDTPPAGAQHLGTVHAGTESVHVYIRPAGQP